MSAFKSRDNSFATAEIVKRIQCLVISGPLILRSASRFQERVFRSHRRIVQPGRNAVCLLDLSILVLQQHALHTVEDTGSSASKDRAVLVRIDTLAGRFDTHQLHVRVLEERCKYANRVRSATYAGTHIVGQSIEALLTFSFALVANGPLEELNQRREGVRSRCRSQQIMSVL